jgi:hypothetical protein
MDVGPEQLTQIGLRPPVDHTNAPKTRFRHDREEIAMPISLPC